MPQRASRASLAPPDLKEPAHISVLLAEALEGLAPRPQGRYLDATLGLGGHSEAILDRALHGRLLGLDKDPTAIAASEDRLKRFGKRFEARRSDFRRMTEAARGFLEPDSPGFDGILMDLGVSSPQLDEAQRGFSFMKDGPLDMRMDPTAGATAAEWLNAAEEAEISKVLWDYGEERQARRIARSLMRARPLGRTLELAEAVSAAVGGRRGAPIHPATRTFQALRIFINRELEAIDEALPQALRLLAVGGRLAVISFHSLEDRRVKEFMVDQSRLCRCPPRVPECRCGWKPTLRLVSKKAIVAGEAECMANPRARSARLRVAERLAP
jgi:16S rRNA (cytosine1402-N4)-methyltransferase